MRAIYGIGEGTLNYFAKTIETAIHELKPLILGMDPFQVEVLTQKLVRDVYSEGAQIHMCAVAAIEIACWDIIGQGHKSADLQPVGRPVPRKAARVRERLVPWPAHAGVIRREGEESSLGGVIRARSSTRSASAWRALSTKIST